MKLYGWLGVAFVWLAGAAAAAEGQIAGVPVSESRYVQRFVLNPGWNLITFQVLPANPQAENVFSRMVPPAGVGGAPLFNPENPQGSPLRALFALDSVREEERIRFLWRSLRAALITDPSDLPSGYPFPELVAGSLNERANAPLGEMAFGEAYLILVSSIASQTVFEMSGEELAVGAPLRLQPGWNLVGFPFDVTIPDQPIPGIRSLFADAHLDRVERVVAWNAPEAQYWSYFPDNPEESRLQLLDPGMGYWIRAADAIVFEPTLVVVAPEDEDRAPTQVDPPAEPGRLWVPGPEDLESSPNVPAIFDTAATQSWLRVRRHETGLRLPLYNAGGGVIGWTAAVTPFLGDVPDGMAALHTSAAIADVFSVLVPQGLVGTETRELEISVDRTHLSPGTYLAELSVRPAVGDERRFTLVVEAGGLEGQWAGFITIDTVNGRANAVPEIDVHLHLTADSLDGSRVLRGFIDSRETLLWPLDAPFIGQVLEPRRSPGWRPDYRARFVLEGNMTLPPGDRNRFPFDSFPQRDGSETREQVDPETGLTYLTNAEGDRWYDTLPGRQDGGTNFSNPGSSFISRRFQFLGAATDRERSFHPLAAFSSASAMDSDIPVIRGRYVETVTGLLNEPIRMEGSFRLRRVSATPYENRPLLVQSQQRRRETRAAGDTLEATVEVDQGTDLLIHRALVFVDQTATDELHRLTLKAPHGKTILLHDRQRVGPARRVVFDSSRQPIDASRLPNAQDGYVTRLPRESLDELRDHRGAGGPWTLSWTHFDSEQVQTFGGWSLLLFGSPIARVAGDVLVAGAPASGSFADVDLDVVGLPVSPGEPTIDFNRETGRFVIDYLPPTRIDVVASKPGYRRAGIALLDDPNHPRGFRDNLVSCH